ncbi:hypothetical protein NCS57_00309300 [Fusarium keratoplasticum]|uniref:Uncharacterized protein n=1 Tax=Fusarium keratoplasticum TaxID=1328300 RepID=A0ACC0RDA3_9HYPO|nr:hypothetical protein NCS57_00309300 [Fusarium keratoplasticum]KAI8680292.1 hypothetical protein NCS57_00309300 [Fusarium keratoplasticum]
MLSSLILGLLPVVYGTIHNTTYDEYPDCAITCLSYNGTEYPNNFANNCDYASGECCTSPYKAIITATWECVWSHCGQEESLEAFEIFADFCEEMNHPLRKDDIPTGYESVIDVTDDEEGEDKDKDDDDNFAGTGLSKAQIIGIAVGAGVTATVTAIGLVLKCCFEELWNRCLGRGRY